MKKFILNALSIFAVIILVINMIDNVVLGKSLYKNFFIQVFVVSVLICIAKLLVEKVQIKYYSLEILLEFILSLIIVLGFGYLFHWYKIDKIGFMCLDVFIVYIVCYCLGIVSTKRDVSLINEKLSQKRSLNNEE